MLLEKQFNIIETFKKKKKLEIGFIFNVYNCSIIRN